MSWEICFFQKAQGWWGSRGLVGAGATSPSWEGGWAMEIASGEGFGLFFFFSFLSSQAVFSGDL